MMDGFEQSVLRAVRLNGGLRPLGKELLRIAPRIESQYMGDVQSLVAAEWSCNSHVMTNTVHVRMLALQGYGVPMSEHLLREVQNAGLPLETAMLMSKEGLREAFGPIPGQVLADTLVHPETNPILHAMLFPPDDGELRIVARRPQLIAARADVIVPNGKASGSVMDLVSTSAWGLDSVETIDLQRAQYLHYKSTEGQPLKHVTSIYIQDNRYEQASEKTRT